MSLWMCPVHGLYGGDVFCPQCGNIGSLAQMSPAVGEAETPMNNPTSPTPIARQMLADQIEQDGWEGAAKRVRLGETSFTEDSAIRAIEKALSRPPGVEKLREENARLMSELREAVEIANLTDNYLRHAQTLLPNNDFGRPSPEDIMEELRAFADRNRASLSTQSPSMQGAEKALSRPPSDDVEKLQDILEQDRDEWREQHENLLNLYRAETAKSEYWRELLRQTLAYLPSTLGITQEIRAKLPPSNETLTETFALASLSPPAALVEALKYAPEPYEYMSKADFKALPYGMKAFVDAHRNWLHRSRTLLAALRKGEM